MVHAFRDHVLRRCLQAGRLTTAREWRFLAETDLPGGRGNPGDGWRGRLPRRLARRPAPRNIRYAAEPAFLGADVSTASVGSPSPTPNWKARYLNEFTDLGEGP
ncbi:hypothetical protein O1M63_37375 [Streptomyces mirabilis]|nr:hypothetical protein [Streptomyces mirabilis]